MSPVRLAKKAIATEKRVSPRSECDGLRVT